MSRANREGEQGPRFAASPVRLIRQMALKAVPLAAAAGMVLLAGTFRDWVIVKSGMGVRGAGTLLTQIVLINAVSSVVTDYISFNGLRTTWRAVAAVATLSFALLLGGSTIAAGFAFVIVSAGGASLIGARIISGQYYFSHMYAALESCAVASWIFLNDSMTLTQYVCVRWAGTALLAAWSFARAGRPAGRGYISPAVRDRDFNAKQFALNAALLGAIVGLNAVYLPSADTAWDLLVARVVSYLGGAASALSPLVADALVRAGIGSRQRGLRRLAATFLVLSSCATLTLARFHGALALFAFGFATATAGLLVLRFSIRIDLHRKSGGFAESSAYFPGMSS